MPQVVKGIAAYSIVPYRLEMKGSDLRLNTQPFIDKFSISLFYPIFPQSFVSIIPLHYYCKKRAYWHKICCMLREEPFIQRGPKDFQ